VHDTAREREMSLSPRMTKGVVPMEERKSYLDNNVLAIAVSLTIIVVGIWLIYQAG
jgi:hypothetical protein